MEKIFMIKTFDGALFTSTAKAQRHLDVMYSNKMSKVAARLTSYTDGKYQRTKAWLDENLEEFIELHRIKTDLNTLPEEDKPNEE